MCVPKEGFVEYERMGPDVVDTSTCNYDRRTEEQNCDAPTFWNHCPGEAERKGQRRKRDAFDVGFVAERNG